MLPALLLVSHASCVVVAVANVICVVVVVFNVTCVPVAVANVTCVVVVVANVTCVVVAVTNVTCVVVAVAGAVPQLWPRVLLCEVRRAPLPVPSLSGCYHPPHHPAAARCTDPFVTPHKLPHHSGGSAPCHQRLLFRKNESILQQAAVSSGWLKICQLDLGHLADSH